MDAVEDTAPCLPIPGCGQAMADKGPCLPGLQCRLHRPHASDTIEPAFGPHPDGDGAPAAHGGLWWDIITGSVTVALSLLF